MTSNHYIEKVEHAGAILAIIVRADFKAEGIQFFTPGEFSQQLGYMHRPQGHLVPPHIHNPVSRNVINTNEVLFVRSGQIRVDFFSDDRRYLESRILNCGDVVLLAAGGHGIEMLQDTELVEVKQGPYAGEQDKRLFTPAECHNCD